MESKKKICKECKTEQKIWGKGYCNKCYKKLFPQKFAIKKSIKPIKKTHIIKKAQRINKFSEKMIVRQKIYQKKRAAYFILHPICEFPGCISKEIQLHHKSGRISNKLYEDFMSCCDFHHKYIHEHPKESYEKGWLFSRIKTQTNE